MSINATIFGQAIAFFFFVVFCMKYVWPPLISAIEDRQKKIADGLAASDRAAKSLEMAQDEAKDKLKAAKEEAGQLIEQANRRKAQILEEAQTEAQTEREKILVQGKAEVDAERNRAREELRTQVADLAIEGAEKILSRTIDKKAHSDILDELVAKL